MAKRNPELTLAIAKRISARRMELKLTQERAADLAGLSRPFYACIERGEKGVGADSLLKICTALEISADYLLTGGHAAHRAAVYEQAGIPAERGAAKVRSGHHGKSLARLRL